MAAAKIKAFADAIARGFKEKRMGDVESGWSSLFAEIDRALNSDDKDTAAIRSRVAELESKLKAGSASNTITAATIAPSTLTSSIKSTQATFLVGDSGGYKLRSAVAAAGESIAQHHAVTIINGMAYLATAANADRRCHGVCDLAPDINGVLYYRAGGEVVGLMAPSSAEPSEMYLSVTPGFFTADPDEAGKVITQDLGLYTGRISTALGNESLVLIDFRYNPPVTRASSWSVLTNGSTTSPEIVFENGDVIMVES